MWLSIETVQDNKDPINTWTETFHHIHHLINQHLHDLHCTFSRVALKVDEREETSSNHAQKLGLNAVL